MKLFFSDLFGDKTPLSISPARVLHHRIHVDRKRIPHAANLDVLVKACIVAILSQNPNVAFTMHHLVLARGVVGYVSV